MPDVHARLSASGSKKWINCPASVAMEEKFPDKGSEFAKEGTTAHSLAELKIRYALGQLTRVAYHKAADLLDTDEDMQDHTDGYRDFVIERYNAARALSPDTMLLVEQRLDFSEYVPDGFGTGDAVIISGGKAEIIDLTLAKNAIRFGEIFKHKSMKTARILTGLENPNSVAQLKDWLEKQTGTAIGSLDKKAVKKLMDSIL